MKLSSPRLYKGKCRECNSDIQMLVEWQWQLQQGIEQVCSKCGGCTLRSCLEEIKN